MNQSLSSSTMSMDRIHEEKFDVEDRLQKVKEELEDIKRQNEDYQKNLALMAKVCDNDSAIEVMLLTLIH